MTPPCGVPVTVSETTPSASTPAPSHARSNLSTRRSDTRRSTSTISRSWSIAPKKSRISASKTNTRPRGKETRIASRASVAPQDVTPVDAVVQGVETTTLGLLGRSP
jgi:hypothetical protein